MNGSGSACLTPSTAPTGVNLGDPAPVTPPSSPPAPPPAGPDDSTEVDAGGGPRADCNKPIKPTVADPINVAIGNLHETEVDFVGQMGGELSLRVERTYNSLSGARGLFGNNWSSNFDIQAYLNATGTALDVRLNSGQVIQFVQSAGSWVAAGNAAAVLVANANGYLLTTFDKHQYQFDASGHLTSLANARGEKLTYQYFPTARDKNVPIKVIDNYGNTMTLTYNNIGTVNTIAVGGQSLSYGYDTANNLTKVTYPATSGVSTVTRQYKYENATFPSALTGLIDETGKRVATWGYNAQGLASSNNRAGLESYTIDYHLTETPDPYALVTKVNPAASNGLGYQWKYHLQTGSDGTVQVIRVEGQGTANCPAGNSYTSYDLPTGHPITVTDGNGNVTLRHYASNGQVDQEISGYRWGTNGNTGKASDLIESAAMHRRVISAWDSTNTWPTVETESGKNGLGQWVDYRETDWVYDAQSRVQSYAVKDLTRGPVYPTRSWSHVYRYYDAPANTKLSVDQLIDPLGSHQSYYDMQGHVAWSDNDLGQKMYYESFTAAGLPTQITDFNYVRTTLVYDPRGRLQKITRNTSPGDPTQGLTTQLAYYDNGLLQQVTQPDNSWLKYTYADGVHLSRIDDNLGDYIVLTLSPLNGQWTQRDVHDHDPSGTLRQTHQRIFDDLGRLLKELDQGGQFQALQYDLNSNLSGTHDALGHGVTRTFDALNRVITETDSLSHTVRFSYDGLGHLTALQDPNGNTTTYSYDGLDNLRSISSPDTGTTTLYPDAVGNVLKKIDARGVEMDYGYDVLSRLNSVTYPGDPSGSENVTFTYDATANGNQGIGHRTGYSNDGGSTALTYDVYGNITQQVETIAGQSYTTLFQYDSANRIKQITYPDGHIETIGRDGFGRVLQIQNQSSAGAAMQPVVSGISYLPFGAATGGVATGQTLGNGVATAQSFDLDGRAGAASATGLTDPNPGASVPGDIDGDGQVGFADLRLLQQYLLGKTTLTAAQLQRADVYPVGQGDGAVTFADWWVLQQKVLSGALH